MRRCCRPIVAPSPTSSPAGPKRFGADLWCCPECGTLVSVFHSCENRHCGQCNGARTQAWLEQRQAEILPIPYFHVTVTVPATLRAALRSNQTVGYAALIKIAAQSIIELARDPRWVGATVGVLAVLHTWTQQLPLHPHVHCLVTGGGLSDTLFSGPNQRSHELQ